MNSLVFLSLLPVVLLIALGFVAGRAGWIRPVAIRDLSNLVFLLLTPALLFRTMHVVHVEQLDFTPVAAYFLAVAMLFGGTLLHWRWQGSRIFCIRCWCSACAACWAWAACR